MNRRRLTIIVVAITWISSILMVIWLFKPTVNVVSPPASPAPVKNLMKQPKKPLIVKKTPHEAPSLPDRPKSEAVVIYNQNIQQGVATSAPQPTPATLPPATIYNYNIQQSETPAAQPPLPTVASTPPICPKVGHYVLSHTPTTDSRQFDDQGNWNPGHMELVRECRNGTLHEFSRYVGHKTP